MTEGTDYAKITHHPRYKYMLLRDVAIQTSFTGYSYAGKWYDIIADGMVVGKAGYMWDGATWVRDTLTFMLGSLAHDILYQGLRDGTLTGEKYSTDEYRDLRRRADKVIVELCRDAGMPWWRRQYVYLGLRLFGTKHTLPHYYFSR